MSDAEKVNNFLEECGVFYLASEDGDQAKVRPLGLHFVYNDKVYFGVGTAKEVYKQITENPKVEIAATKPDASLWIRYYGEAEFDDDPVLLEKVFETIPDLKQIYNEETGLTLGVFSLANATAEIRSMMAVEEKIEF